MKPNCVWFFLIFFLFLTAPADAQNPDVALFRFLNNRHTPFSDRFFNFQTQTVKPVSVAMPVAFIGTGLIADNRKAENTGALLFLAQCMNFGLTYGLKMIVNRKRPYESLSNVHLPAGKEGTRSFPSGHTSAAFTSATMLSLNYPKWYIIAPAYTWAGFVAYSRIALGVHYPSDVLAGAIIGSAVAWTIYHYRTPILKEKNQLFRNR